LTIPVSEGSNACSQSWILVSFHLHFLSFSLALVHEWNRTTNSVWIYSPTPTALPEPQVWLLDFYTIFWSAKCSE
jgi:hypothetical protein